MKLANPLFKYRTSVYLTLLITVSFLIRIWHINKVSSIVFDEVYFVKFAQNYLSGKDFFDIHPPLGKLIIALSIKIFGDNAFAWRFFQAVFGTLLVWLGYLTGKELSSRLAGIFAATIFALDGMLLVYSRVGLMDIFLSFFILLTFYFFLKCTKNNQSLYLSLSGISLGLAASVKYIGWLTLLILIFVIIVKKLNWKKYWPEFILYLFVTPSLIYLAFFLFNFNDKNFFYEVYKWHHQSFTYNITLEDTHPYASKWWSWFLLVKPIWMYLDFSDKKIGICGIGNPILWWSFLIVFPLLIWQTYRKYFLRKAVDNAYPILLFSFSLYLFFWAFFDRVLFNYHAMPSFLFLSLGSALFLEKLWQKESGKYLVGAFFILALVFFVYFLPIWLGLPLAPYQFDSRILLPSWL